MNPDSSLRMKERPILFSGPMVRAILNGSKTQTRRMVKPQPVDVDNYDGAALLTFSDAEGAPSFHIGPKPDGFPCPYGQPGDRLWVKETWATAPNFDHMKPTDLPEGISILKRANQGATGGKWRPSIFMRRWMSRITLEIESVRVERLQDISEEDAKAEGIDPASRFETGSGEVFTFAECYNLLWNSINGPGSWDANPWVWVVEFKRIKP